MDFDSEDEGTSGGNKVKSEAYVTKISEGKGSMGQYDKSRYNYHEETKYQFDGEWYNFEAKGYYPGENSKNN